MRGKKTLQLDGFDRPIDVFELTFKEIQELFNMEDVNGSTFDALLSHFGGHILPMVTNLTLAELEALAPSEAKLIWEAVQEVNAVFFGIVNETGVSEFLSRFKSAILTDFLNYAAASLSGAIRTSGTTDTPISSEP